MPSTPTPTPDCSLCAVLASFGPDEDDDMPGTATHRDAPEIEVIWIERDDGYGPYGAKSIGESGKVPAVAAVANAIFNATGRRMKDLPITRDRILGALA